MKQKIYIISLFLLIFSSFLNAQSQGEKLFKENKPKEAVQVLENEILNNQISANTYNFLGLGYYQLEDYAKSLEAFERGIKAQPGNVKILSFNKGNTYYAMKDYASAISAYSQSFLDDATFYEALLNRANAFLMADQLNNAKSDYELFIEKCPDDPQSSKIEKLIQALVDEMARREEEARLLAEQNKALWEEFDPSIDENQLDDSTEWEKVDVSIENTPVAKEDEWQKVDASIENKMEEKKSDWQKVDASISENKQNKKTEWEAVEESESGTSGFESANLASKSEEKIGDGEKSSSSESDNYDWEKLEIEKMANLSGNDSEIYEDDENLDDEWEILSDEENLELKRLEKESREAYEEWLAEQSLLRQLEAEEELKKLQAQDDEERLSREKLLKELMEAEEARRKKLLEDVANSLQNSDSTNMTSGADELLEYDQEGVLD